MGDMRDSKKENAGSSETVGSNALSALAPKPKPYRILIVGDHSVVRRGIRAILEIQRDIEFTEALNGTEALELAKATKPDLVLIDQTLEEMSDLNLTRAIGENLPETRLIVLAMHFSEKMARESLRCGALGYMLKSDADDVLLAAVDHARHGQPFFTTKLASAMAQNFMTQQPAYAMLNKKVQPTFPLTQREIQVAQLLAEGKSNKQVAAALDISTRTIEAHRNHIMHKMNFASFSDLIKFAMRNNMTEP
jgi:DNA-binding NarL/FixJ family response regulator